MNRAISNYFVVGILWGTAGLPGVAIAEPPPRTDDVAPSPASESAIVPVSAGDWPWWRGPTQDGRSIDEKAPLRWNVTDNVVWKAVIPGRGYASPVLCGDKIFLATADEQEKVQSLLCLDRKTGREIWQTAVHKGGFDHMHKANTQASASPACDGTQVYITFLNRKGIWVTAVDLDGKIVWQTEAGKFSTLHGYAASPTLWKSLVIAAGDCEGKGFLTAVDRTSGKIVWQVERPDENSYSSPIVSHVGGRDQILMSGCGFIGGYDPASGERIWHCDQQANSTASTLIYDQDHVYAGGAFPKARTLCLRADGAGDVTQTAIVWQNTEKLYVPSMVLAKGLLFAVNGNGVAFCFQAESGKELWKQRLGGNVSASPVVAGQHLYACNADGKTFVYKVAPQFELVAENDLADGIFASPAICGGRIYLRTLQHLYCIGSTAE